MQRIAFCLVLFCAVGCGGARKSASTMASYAYGDSGSESVTASVGSSGSSGSGGATAGVPGSAAPVAASTLPEQLVIDGSLQLEVGKIENLIAELRAQVEQAGGGITEEEVSGLDAGWSARITLRVPPPQLPAIITWLGSRGDITDKKLSSTDVAKTLFDQELALKNAQVTSERLEALLRQGGLNMQDVLAVERELTRLRGEIESIKGQAQFLKDRVALATLRVWITRRSDAVRVASAKAYPGARFAALILLEPDGRPRTRIGGGLIVHTLFRAATFELELYRGEPGAEDGSDESMAVMATLGGATYSDFLGRGERRFGNPYLGFRAGYGYLDSHRFVVQAEAGVELFKTTRFMIDANVRLSGLIGERTDAAAILGGSAVIAF